MLAEIVREAEKNLDHTLVPKLRGITVRQVLAKGDSAQAIVRTAQQEQADLIMMPSHGHTFYQYLVGSAATKVLHGTECPIWTGAHVEESSVRDLALRNVLCAVNFNSRDRKAVSWAAQMAATFGAGLTLAHVTAGVELWGPGGNCVNSKWKE